VAGDHIRHNRAFWDADADAYQDTHGSWLGASPRAWGAFRVPEADLRVLGDVAGLDVLELGCGAAQWSVALAADGARVTGLDLSRSQLAHARRASASVPLVCANGEQIPLRDDAFDVVFSDHGATSFCEPDALLAEAARILRPGGLLAFCVTHPLLVLTWSREKERQTRKLQTGYDGLGRMDWGEGAIDWVLTAGEWVQALGRHGFTVDRLVELTAPEGATTTYTEFIPVEWARHWPGEWIWRARLSGVRT